MVALSLSNCRYCPDINKEALCGGTGEGLGQMIRHFLVSDLAGKPSPDFPVLPHQDVWRLFDFSADEEIEAARPTHVLMAHESVVVSRHCFIVQVLFSMLCSIVRTNSRC